MKTRFGNSCNDNPYLTHARKFATFPQTEMLIKSKTTRILFLNLIWILSVIWMKWQFGFGASRKFGYSPRGRRAKATKKPQTQRLNWWPVLIQTHNWIWHNPSNQNKRGFNAEDVLNHIERVATKLKSGTYFIFDQASIHTCEQVRNSDIWLKYNLHPLYIPVSCPELNAVEYWNNIAKNFYWVRNPNHWSLKDALHECYSTLPKCFCKSWIKYSLNCIDVVLEDTKVHQQHIESNWITWHL